MNTKVRTIVGLVLVMAIGILATLSVLGMFSAKPASADQAPATVTVTPTKARSIAQYTINVTGVTGMNAIEVGGTIAVKFNTSTGVPSSIASSAIKLKATLVGPGGTSNQLVSASAVIVSGNSGARPGIGYDDSCGVFLCI